jgi:hypothetical protein
MTQLRTLLPFSMLRVCVHYLYVVHWGLIELSAAGVVKNVKYQ